MQGGVGSADSVVAPEESCTSPKVYGMMLMAFAKLSLGGGGTTTWKFSGFDCPPPGGRFATEMLSVLPKGLRRAAGRVAVMQVGGWQESVGAAMVMPFGAPLNSTLALLEKFVPVNWIGTGVEGVVCTGVLEGLMLVMVGVRASTENVRALLAVLFTITLICTVPAISNEFATVALRLVSVPPASIVTPVVDPFHWIAPPVSPIPVTVNVNEALVAFTLDGDSAEICGPEKMKLFRLMSQAPRPCVAARRVREGSWRRKE